MKKIILSALILSMAVAVQAQVGKGRHHGRKHRVDAMQKLNLSEDQKAKFKTQNEEFRKNMSELKKNEDITVKEWKSKMGQLRKDHQEKTQSILTGEQKDQMEKMRAERKEKFQEHARKRGDMMKEKLGLTADQQAKLKENREAMKVKMKSIREDKSIDEGAKREKMKELMKEQKDKMKSVLSEEQLKKMKEGRKEHFEKRKTHQKKVNI